MLLGMLSGFIGSVIGLSVHLILLFYKTACSLSNKNGGFTWYVGHSGKIQIVIYVALIVLFIFADYYRGSSKFLKKKSKKDAIYAYLFKVIFLLFSVVILTLKTHPNLEINMLDVGQGDGIVISCEGRNILIDGGSTSKKKVGKYSIIPFLKYKGIGKLDAVVITHEDQDHISGVLEIMDDMEKGGIVIKSLFLPDVSPSSREDNYRKLETRAKELGIPINYISCGESFSVHEAEFTCLNPTKDMVTEGANAYSTVLFMRYGKLTALFTGDVEKEGQEHLLKDLRKHQDKFGNITILKVAHHGSQYTTDREFLEILKPKIALISCGVDNSYGHPHKELLERLNEANSIVYRTDESGAITVEMKDNKLSIHEYLNDIDKEN
jgi:competence protein ComEC